METTEQYQLSDFELTVEVMELEPSEFEPVIAQDTVTDDTLSAVEDDVFTFGQEVLAAEEPLPVEDCLLSAQLTEFEQHAIDAVLAGNFDPFSAAYALPDGSIHMGLYWTALSLADNLAYYEIAEADYTSTMIGWLPTYAYLDVPA